MKRNKKLHLGQVAEYYAKQDNFSAIHLLPTIFNEVHHFPKINLLFRVTCDLIESYSKYLNYGAAQSGNIELLEWTMSHGRAINLTACAKAAESGQLNVIKWLASKMDSWSSTFYISSKWTQTIARAAAKGGHLHIFAWMSQNNVEFKIKPEMAKKAARKGHLNILEWLWKQNQQKMVDLLDVICEKAAKGGHLDILLWAKNNGFQFSSNNFVQAVCGGHMHIIQYLCNCGVALWTDEVLELAAEKGHLEVLKWAVENAVDNFSRVCIGAARGGHLHILKWARKNHFPWKEDWLHFYPPQNKGYLDALKWAVDIGNKLKKLVTCERGAGDLEVLKFLRQNNCEWDTFLMDAVDKGNLEALKWALANGCPWNNFTDKNYDKTIWKTAGRNGNMEIIKLLISMEKPDSAAYIDIGCSAAEHGCLNVLKFVLSQKAVCIYNVVQAATMPASYWLWKQM